MSTQKRPNETITNRQIYERLMRLGWKKCPVEFLISFIGLHLVNKGKVISLSRAVVIIKQSKLDQKLIKNKFPVTNIIESLIYLVIYKQKLIDEFIEHKEYPVWQDEIIGPIFDILEQLRSIYRV